MECNGSVETEEWNDRIHEAEYVSQTRDVVFWVTSNLPLFFVSLRPKYGEPEIEWCDEYACTKHGLL